MYMGEEDVCDTGLALSLGYGGPRRVDNQSMDHLRPERSLTLSLSDDDALKVETKKESDDTHSTVSSFSTVYPTSLKREVDVALNDTEGERANSSRASDEDEDGGARKKLRLTKEQSALLEDRFKEHSTLNPKQKQALAKQLHLRPRQVEVWFQNRRARTKLKQTEVDCEFLKRCCENLTDENRRLQKEIQELRALKFASSPPLYMQTLTMCPSCERIGGGGADKGGNAAGFVLATNPKGGHFFSPFTGHQAAC